MNTQDRAVVKALLQYMTERHLTGSEEFRAALKHFNITTTYIDQQVSDEAAALLGKEHNHFVDVFRPSSIDTQPHGERYWFATKAEAEDLSTCERMSGDEPVNTRVLAARAAHDKALAMNIESAHAEALEMDAEFNFERISREINTGIEPVSPAPGDEPDAITVTEALTMFLDRWAVLDAQAVGKRYIVAFPSRCHDGKLIKHGTCNTREDALQLLADLPVTRGIERGLLVVLKAL